MNNITNGIDSLSGCSVVFIHFDLSPFKLNTEFIDPCSFDIWSDPDCRQDHFSFFLFFAFVSFYPDFAEIAGHLNRLNGRTGHDLHAHFLKRPLELL